MRLTSKIYLGFITAIFSFTFITIVYLAIAGDRTPRMVKSHTFSEELTEITIPKYKVLLIEISEVYAWGKIDFHQNTDKMNKLSLPKDLENYVGTKLAGDTLKLSFDLAKINELNAKDSHMSISNLNLGLYADNSVSVISKVRGLEINFEGIEVENAKFTTNGKLKVIDSKMDNLTLSSTNVINVINSTISTFNLDLDGVHSWNIDNCIIDTENLTGSNLHRVSLPKTECKTLNWIPKTDNAKINITISDTISMSFK